MFNPSQTSVASSDIDLDDCSPDLEIEGSDMYDGNYLLVAWPSLMKALSKCQVHGCPESVLPSNMAVRRNGIYFLR